MNVFRDKVAIVTGGSSGIGRALCEEMGRLGVTGRNTERAEQVTSSIISSGGRARVACLDVTKAGDVENLVREVASEHGRLDYMFNNAGIAIKAEVLNAEYIKLNREAVSKKLASTKMMDAGVCAKIILAGVARKKPMIPVTSFARIYWLVYRLAPNFLLSLARKSVKKGMVSW